MIIVLGPTSHTRYPGIVEKHLLDEWMREKNGDQFCRCFAIINCLLPCNWQMQTIFPHGSYIYL